MAVVSTADQRESAHDQRDLGLVAFGTLEDRKRAVKCSISGLLGTRTWEAL
jgi:hypothetical protein